MLQTRKRHHLPRHCYVGAVRLAITACIEDGEPVFRNLAIIDTFVKILREAVEAAECSVLVYCFMPEHVHLIVAGNSENSDTWQAIARFKRRTGYWFSRHSTARWQRDFYDHIIRRDEDLANQIRYIVNNPVRRGLVERWMDYPGTGSIGANLNDVLADVSTS